jgi:mRNA-degrading endonuclease toxin of MazEF toxin-antitoxin module
MKGLKIQGGELILPSHNYSSRKELKDVREFEFGSVWKIDDRDISIPQADKLGGRLIHQERWVVVISNNNENFHPLCPVVTVAPLSHRTDLKRSFDLELFKDEDKVSVHSLLQLKLCQPILKVDLYEEQGHISDGKKDELQVLIEDFYGLSFEE